MKIKLPAIALLILTGLAALLMGTSPAFAGCHCQLSFQWSEALWGTGATCGAAKADSLSNVYAWIEGQCIDGVCATGEELLITNPMSDAEGCTPKDGMFRADYQVQYKCWICVDRPPREQQ